MTFDPKPLVEAAEKAVGALGVLRATCPYSEDTDRLAHKASKANLRFRDEATAQAIIAWGAAHAAQAAEIERLREALEWYAARTAECRLIHSGGDSGRQALSADGGDRARTALTGGASHE